MYNLGDLVRINGTNSVGVLKCKQDSVWEISTVFGKQVLSENEFSIFNKEKEIAQIKKSLSSVNWDRLEKISINCPDCKQTLQILKSLTV